MDHVGGGGQVQAGAAGLEREYKYTFGTVVLEALDHGVPFAPRDATMRKQGRLTVAFADPAVQQFAHFPELGEDQHFLVVGVNVVDEFEKVFRLAGQRGLGLAPLQVLCRVVADLFQGQDHLQYQPLTLEAVRLAVDDAQSFPHHRFIEYGLGRREGAVLVLFDLVRQIVDDALVGLQSAQQKGRSDAPEAFDDPWIAMGLDGHGVFLGESGEAAEVALIGEIHDAPVFG